MDQGVWMGYNWPKAKKFFNQFRVNFNHWYSRLVTPIDILKRDKLMYQGAGGNTNINGQTKKLWWVGANVNWRYSANDYYEARLYGRVWKNKPRVNAGFWWESNSSKKLSWGGEMFTGKGGYFNRSFINPNLFGKIRFNSKFSVDHMVSMNFAKNDAGWASILPDAADRGALYDTVIFSRRQLSVIENKLSAKYNFNNKMGITFRARHYFSKVKPVEFYQLGTDGYLKTPTNPFTGNVNQNYNYFTVDMVYTWQFAQGSFIYVVWKDISESFSRNFESNYISNLGKTLENPQSNSLSVRVIYFLDYLTAKKQLHSRKRPA